MTEPTSAELDPERQRLVEADAGREPWREWGPYVAERAWGTVREDYSRDGNAWGYFPFDDATWRTYRWNEDGLLSWCDAQQRLCLGLALWNGKDPILKERLFGLPGPEGKHGEDVKEYWWYVDNTPTHSWMRSRYLYPTEAFPYDCLHAGNAARTVDDPEFELLDTDVFDGDRYVEVVMDWAKAGPRDTCLRIGVQNKGQEPVTLHVLPTAWFRNTWSWAPTEEPKPSMRATSDGIAGQHATLGAFMLSSRAVSPAGQGAADPPAAAVLCCDNETNVRDHYGTQQWGGQEATLYPKDGIANHVVAGRQTVNPEGEGTKAAFHHVLSLGPGESQEVRVRLVIGDEGQPGALDDTFEELMAARQAEADAFWAELLADLDQPTAEVARQALSSLLSTKQFYAYDVTTWLNGDPKQGPPPERADPRNTEWTNLSAADVIVMPDAWEYPWFASWDLAFHCVTLAHVDPELAKSQLLLLLCDRYQHPSGAIPAYEWKFSDTNPPIQAWAALEIFRIDGQRDTTFLEHVLHKLLINVTWWFNRVDAEGDDLFEGGFLGLDNIGPFNRSDPLPDGLVLEQSDGTAWAALYCLDLLMIAVTLGAQDPAYDGIAATFLDRFCAIARAANELGLWDDEDGFYYDLMRHQDGSSERLRVRSAVGLVPIFAVGQLPQEAIARMPRLAERLQWLRDNRPDLLALMHFDEDRYLGLLAVCEPDRLLRVMSKVVDPEEFLSDHGARSLSAFHRGHPVTVNTAEGPSTVDYEPAESRSTLYGGNSNWRGPVWMPINTLLVAALRRYHTYCHGELLVPFPTGQGEPTSLGAIADALASRLIGLFLRDGGTGDRPSTPGFPWQEQATFFEYFDGDTGRGLGASHQTGWTALVASLALGWPR